jgi:hypothetical protein
VDSRAAHRAHFVKSDVDAERSSLPGCFGAGKSSADDVNRFQCSMLKAQCSMLNAERLSIGIAH